LLNGFASLILICRVFLLSCVCKHFVVITFIAYHVERGLFGLPVAREMNAVSSIMLVVKRVNKVLPSKYQ
jgi:hypothetical protein